MCGACRFGGVAAASRSIHRPETPARSLRTTMDLNDPLYHSAESGFVEVRGNRYYALTDPRSHYFASTIKADGGAWSPEHQAYIMPTDLTEEFERACERIASMPWRPLDENMARYCSDELYKMGVMSIQKPVFADNPNGPKKKVYVAPNEELFDKANELIFNASRITPEQVAKINGYIASGEATPTILDGTPQEFAAKLKSNSLSQSDAKKILRHLEPAPEQAIEEFRNMIVGGRLTEKQLGFDPNAEPERVNGLKAQQVYDFINEGKKMADHDLKKKVAAYQNLGAFGNQEIYYDDLTAAKARSLVKTGQIFASGDEFSKALDEVDRNGFGLAGERGAYGQRVSANGTDQGAFEGSLEKMTSLLKNGEIDGLDPNAKAVDFPTHGYAAGGVAWASAHHAILAIDETHYTALNRKDIALEKGLDLRDHVGEFVAFACRRNDRPYGVLTNANTVGQAICEMDARQTLHDTRRAFKAAETPTTPVQGKVIAMRGDFASLDLGDAGILTVPKAELTDPAPKYNATVGFEPATVGATAGSPARTRTTGGRGR
jgi:hypothetical protein